MPCVRPVVFLELISARKMAFGSIPLTAGIFIVLAFSDIQYCEGQYFQFRNYEPVSSTPLPFPPCRMENIDCLQKVLRTFFFLMGSGSYDMKSIDPIILPSVTIALPNEQLSILMRNINVTGAKWSKLVNRKFNLLGGKNGVMFTSNLHATGEITLSMAGRIDPFVASITMDLHEIESNITYALAGERGYDNEDYLFIGPERIAPRNTRLPSFFLQPAMVAEFRRPETRDNITDKTEDAYMIEQVLTARQPILDHMANEITIAVMHTIVDNFRVFASKVPVRNYYSYNK